MINPYFKTALEGKLIENFFLPIIIQYIIKGIVVINNIVDHIRTLLNSCNFFTSKINRNVRSATMYDMEKNGKRHDNCLDIHWTKLQTIHNWYAIFPAIGYQYDNYSDIENKYCTYGC